MATTNSDIMPVRGELEPATREGFSNMITKANLLYAEGLTMVGIVNVGQKTLGGIFVKVPQRKPGSLL